LPLLATVGNPVAVNPNDRLSDTASKNLWPIHLPN
jgi:phosphoserine phosphatase